MMLFDYVDAQELNALIMDNMVSARCHPDAPLTVLNYTHHAQASGDWGNETLRKCRGLIYNHDTREIVAIPWQKFFNYGDPNTGELPDERVTVTNKMDGSLGILYHTPDGRKWVATRGSFTSDQALHATEWLRTNQPDFEWSLWLTPLVEIIYPENRIVLNYGGQDKLVLLGSTYQTIRGEIIYLTPENTRLGTTPIWEGEITEMFEADTLAAALALPPRENAEGLVVQFESGKMVKVKQEDYLRLHRILYSLSNKFIWEQMVNSENFEFTLDPEIVSLLPAEILDWVYATEDDYSESARDTYRLAMNHLERYDNLQLSKDYHKIVALSVKDESKDIRSAVLMQMRFGLDENEAMKKILYWQGYGTFTRPQNVENEEA